MSIIIALLIFSAIILFHELGHFSLAKFNGVTVTEFSLGMGPRLLSFEKGGTRYCLKLLPFGGSCMMLGEDEGDGGEGTFGSKSVWARMSVIAAGPIFNFILAYLLALILVANIGYDKPEVLAVSEGFGAAESGIEPGDVILSINGKKISVYREVTNYVTFHQDKLASGEPIKVVFERDGEEHTVYVTPKDNGSGRYLMGISGSSSYRTKLSLPGVLKYSAIEVKYWIETTYASLGMMLSGGVSVNDVSGPVGVVTMIGDTYNESRTDGAFYVFINLINIAILLTANLGVMNLLPLPALDGGRLVFLIIEAIRRKRIDPEVEGRVHLAGLLLLMLLMVVIMFNDVLKIFR